MIDDWKKLQKIPQMKLVHNDNWEYRCTAYTDVIIVEYWEERSEGMTQISQFDVPTFCAKQLFDELTKLAADATEE